MVALLDLNLGQWGLVIESFWYSGTPAVFCCFAYQGFEDKKHMGKIMFSNVIVLNIYHFNQYLRFIPVGCTNGIDISYICFMYLSQQITYIYGDLCYRLKTFMVNAYL